MRELCLKHPICAILRNVPLEETEDYARAVFEGGTFLKIAQIGCFKHNSLINYTPFSTLEKLYFPLMCMNPPINSV